MKTAKRSAASRCIVGGGLGAVPYMAKLFDSFVPVEEILPLAQAVARVFARLGEKKNRSRARIKFLIQDLGIEKFSELVLEERKTLPPDPRWTDFVDGAERFEEAAAAARRRIARVCFAGLPALAEAQHANSEAARLRHGHRRASSRRHHRQSTALLGRHRSPLHQRNGAHHGRAEFCHSLGEQERFARHLRGVGSRGSGTSPEPAPSSTSSPARERIPASWESRPRADWPRELRKRLLEKSVEMDEAVENLHIKISGCFNSCGQHHVADLGFYGVSRKMAGYAVPHFQVVLGGEWEHNGGSYGLPVVAIPSKNIPEVVDAPHVDVIWPAGRRARRFKDFVKRVGKVEMKKMLEDLAKPPADPSDRSFFSDWGDPREYTLGDMATGECAGEVVSANRVRSRRRRTRSYLRRRSPSIAAAVKKRERKPTSRCFRLRAGW